RASGLQHVQPEAAELLVEQARDLVRQAADQERRGRRLKARGRRLAGPDADPRRVRLERAGRGGRRLAEIGRKPAGPHGDPRRAGLAQRGVGHREGGRPVGPPHLRDHVADRRHARDRVATVGPAVRVRARQPAIEVDRAAAHPGHDVRVLQNGVLGADQDEVLIGPEVVEDVDHLDVEALGGRTAEDREPVAAHPRPDLVDPDEAAGSAHLAGGHGRDQQRRKHQTDEDGPAHRPSHPPHGLPHSARLHSAGTSSGSMLGNERRISISDSSENGLITTATAPARRAASRDSRLSWVDMSTTGTPGWRSLMVRASSIPLIPGRVSSTSTRSTGHWLISSRAASPALVPTTRFPRKVSMRASRHWRSGSSSTTSTPRSREGGTDATARRAASIFSPSVRTEASAGSLLRGRGGGWLSRRSWLIARRKGGNGKGSGPKNAWRAHPFPSKPADNRENLRKAQSGP